MTTCESRVRGILKLTGISLEGQRRGRGSRYRWSDSVSEADNGKRDILFNLFPTPAITRRAGKIRAQFTRAARPSPLRAMRPFKRDGGIPGASPSHWAPVWNVVMVIFVKQFSVRFLEMLTPHLLARVLFLFVSQAFLVTSRVRPRRVTARGSVSRLNGGSRSIRARPSLVSMLRRPLIFEVFSIRATMDIRILCI